MVKISPNGESQMPQDNPSREGDHLFGYVAKGETGSTTRRLGITAFATICCVLGVFAVSRFWPESTPYDDKVRDLEQGMTWGAVQETLGTPRFVFISYVFTGGSYRSYIARGIRFVPDGSVDGEVLVYWEDGKDWVLLVGLKGIPEKGIPEKIDKWCIQKSKDNEGNWHFDLSDFSRDAERHAPQTKCHSMR